MKRLIGMMGAGDHCVLISQADEIQTQSGTSLALNTRTTSPTQHALVLCNSIGTPIESKYVDFQPMHWSMNTTHVLVASKSYFYLWGYQSAVDRTALKRQTFEKLVYIENPNVAIQIKSDDPSIISVGNIQVIKQSD